MAEDRTGRDLRAPVPSRNRAATDFLRGDTEGSLYLGVLSLTQMLSAAAAAAALVLLLAHVHKTSRGAELAKGV